MAEFHGCLRLSSCPVRDELTGDDFNLRDAFQIEMREEERKPGWPTQ
jgi:hypothetical protein